MPHNKRVTVESLAVMFIEWLKRHRSENTLKMYTGRLKAFREAFGDRRPKKIKKWELEDHFLRENRWPDGTEKAPDTIRANYIAAEQLEKFALRNELIKKRFLYTFDKPVGRLRERLPTPEEVDKIKSVASPAFRLVYQALRQSGARPNEIARMTFADWDQSNSVIVLLKHKTAWKTGRPRKITVGEKLRGLILESLAGRTEGPLFVTPRGKAWTSNSISQTFSRYRNRVGVDKAVVCYSARHEHATAICSTLGMDAAADALGHVNTTMTRRYVHKDPATLRSNQDSVSL